MFISRATVETIITECVDVLSSIKHLRDLDDRVWDKVSTRMRQIIHDKSTVDMSKYKDRQLAGVKRAKANGVYKGRKSRFTEVELAEIRNDFLTTENKVEAAGIWGISRAYFYKIGRGAYPVKCPVEEVEEVVDPTVRLNRITSDFNNKKLTKIAVAEKWGISRTELYEIANPKDE
jgi:hypothetical protein